jgi:hypothetical protein
MKETDFYHLLTQHPVITFIVCAVFLMVVTLIIAAKLTNRAEQSPDGEDKDKNDLK